MEKKTLKSPIAKSDINKYSKFIVVDEDNKPMTFQDGQFCYNTDSDWQDEHFAIKSYTKAYANRLIFISKTYRKSRKFDVPRYKLMPIQF